MLEAHEGRVALRRHALQQTHEVVRPPQHELGGEIEILLLETCRRTGRHAVHVPAHAMRMVTPGVAAARAGRLSPMDMRRLIGELVCHSAQAWALAQTWPPACLPACLEARSLCMY